MTQPLPRGRSPGMGEFDAVLRHHPYHPQDFVYIEDLEQRWTAVAIFGAILAVAVTVSRFATLTVGFPVWEDGLLLMIFGAVGLFGLGPLLWFESGEASAAGLLAGVTLLVVGLLLDQGVDRAWLGTVVVLYLIGTACVVLGGSRTIRLRRTEPAQLGA